jgi:hypothetical protein
MLATLAIRPICEVLDYLTNFPVLATLIHPTEFVLLNNNFKERYDLKLSSDTSYRNLSSLTQKVTSCGPDGDRNCDVNDNTPSTFGCVC